jgi:hypothetical protein
MKPIARRALALATLLLAPLLLAPAAFAQAQLDVRLRTPRRGPVPARCTVREWVPGHYETRLERVWVPGATRQEWRPARQEWRLDLRGCAVLVLVEPGRWITVTEPGRFETRERREWVPGYWRMR